ncbi:hypothetical protein EYZ11_002680 [Aspergillus tanneri]|uniref:ADF-H domain-containing protein n=1 Tax=Aspergillus tanneri TaxID=1220188 RepID=A0A4S3JSC6_9EURO|nr:hypothetical protein EYZ11_002680 [Aspergillus tanneri]
MQSGISVSPELHDAFNNFVSDSSIFCLPVTISSESLAPLTPVPFSAPNAFYPSLSQLSSVLEPKTPIYLLIRQPQGALSSLVALTYIPSNAGVRAKTLFASTRATLARELGTEKFASSIFATEEDEVMGEQAWREREAEKNGSSSRGGFQREDLMGEKERELEAVRRAEEEARSGTPGRDIGIGGSFIRGNGGGLFGPSNNARFQMPVDEDAKDALKSLQQGGLVQLVIDIPKETVRLAAAESGVNANSVQKHISSSSPRSSIKERMLYASSRLYALQLAEDQGLKIMKKIEASSPDEVSGEQLQEEVNPSQTNGPQRGFARPRRPGSLPDSRAFTPDSSSETGP